MAIHEQAVDQSPLGYDAGGICCALWWEVHTRLDNELESTDEFSGPERKRGARLLLAEAGPHAVALGAHENFTAAFAIHLGASSLQVGVLAAANHLLLAASQFYSVQLIRVLGGRKRMLVATALLSALAYVFMALVPVVPSAARVWTLVLVSAFALALTYIGLPAWGSLVADLVPRHRRGRFLGLRGSIATGAALAVGLTGALVLDGLGQKVVWGFAAVFVVAVAARLVSAAILKRVADPRPDLRIDAGEAPWRQLMHLGETTLGKYNRFILVSHVCFGMGGPFLALYFLRDLQMSYLGFVSLGVVSMLTTMVASPMWGRLADLRSTRLVLVLSGALMVLYPLLWILSAQTWYLYLVFGAMGIGIAGWMISAYNFVLENSEEEGRAAAVGSFHAMAAIGIFAGALVGGAIATHLPTLFSHQVMTLFLLSFVLRLVTVTALLPGAISRRGFAGVAESLAHKRMALAAPLRHGLAAAWHVVAH